MATLYLLSSIFYLRCLIGATMKVSLNFLIRILGMGVLAYSGRSIGQALSSPQPNENERMAVQLLTLAGAGLGLLTTHRWTIEPFQRGMRYIRSKIGRASCRE